MNIAKIVLCILAAVILTMAAIAAAPAFEGTWVGTAVLPDQTVDEITLVLEKAEKGYKGKIGDGLGVLAPDTPLIEASFDGKELKIVFPTADGVIITVLVKAEGERLTGQWSDEEGESGKVEMARKK